MQLPASIRRLWGRLPPRDTTDPRPERRRRRRLYWVAAAGLALVVASLAVRNSPWARERQMRRMSAGSLNLLALERPRDSLVFVYLGRSLYQAGDVQESFQAFDTAARLAPRSHPAHLGRGITLLALEQPYEAERALVRAVELNPTAPLPHFKLAELYYRYRNSTSTIQPLERVIELDPKHDEAWYRLGMAWGDLHQFDRALAALEKAVALNDRKAMYLRDLGQVQQQFGRVDDARRSLNRSRDLDPRDPGTLVLLASLEIGQGGDAERLATAETLLQQAIALDPRYAAAYRELGAVRLRRRELPGAVQALRQAVRYDQSDGRALFQLGQALIRSGEREEGRECIKGFEMLSEARRSVTSVEDRIHQDPKNPDLRLRMARLYRKYGRDDRAVNQYQIYLHMMPGDAPVARELQAYTESLSRPAAQGKPEKRG